jgi:hypothetical protein
MWILLAVACSKPSEVVSAPLVVDAAAPPPPVVSAKPAPPPAAAKQPTTALAIVAKPIAIDVDDRAIIVRDLDARGRETASRTVGNADGDVERDTVTAASRGDAIWIGWFEGKDDGHVAKAMRVGGKPFVVTRSDAPAWSMRIAPLADGRAVIAASGKSSAAKCVGRPPEEKKCSGPGWDVVLATADGDVKTLRHGALDVGPGVEIEAAFDIGDAVAIGVFGWHGGAVFDDVVVPYGPSPNKTPSVAYGHPPRRIFRMGQDILTYSPSEFCVKEPGSSCPHATISRRGGSGNYDITDESETCNDGLPSLKLTHKSGGFGVVLGVWTGEASLDVDNGSVRARACKDGKIVTLDP